MNFEQNERMEEMLLVVGDWFRTTNPRWFVALGLTIALAIPGYFFTSYSFGQILIAGVKPVQVNYTPPNAQALQNIEQKVFSYGDGTYSGYARVRNQNSEWGVPELDYQVLFKTSGGSTVQSMGGTVYIGPSSDKVIVFPRFSASEAPTTVSLSFTEPNFIRPPSIPTVDLEIQRRDIQTQGNQTLVNAVIVNRMPFKISRVDLPVLIFDRNNQVISAGYTNINDLESNESRSFQYTWPASITNAARIEILPEINAFNRNIFQLGPGQNPFDP